MLQSELSLHPVLLLTGVTEELFDTSVRTSGLWQAQLIIARESSILPSELMDFKLDFEEKGIQHVCLLKCKTNRFHF